MSNYNFTPGTGSIGASDTIGGVEWPRVKFAIGVAGTATDVSGSNPVPTVNAGGTVTIAGSTTVAAGTLTAVTSITNTVTIAGAAANAGGTVTISGALPAGSAAIGSVSIVGGGLALAGGTTTISGALPAGTNAIGTVTVLGSITVGALTGGTTTAIGGGGTVTISGALPAGSAALGTVTITGFDKGAGSATASTMRVAIVTEQVDGSEYTAGAAATTTIMGPTGATGDFLSYVTVFPQVAACGSVTIKDSATVIGSFPGGGNTALPTLVPFTINIGATSLLGRWSVVTGGSVTILGVGNFT